MIRDTVSTARLVTAGALALGMTACGGPAEPPAELTAQQRAALVAAALPTENEIPIGWRMQDPNALSATEPTWLADPACDLAWLTEELTGVGFVELIVWGNGSITTQRVADLGSLDAADKALDDIATIADRCEVLTMGAGPQVAEVASVSREDRQVRIEYSGSGGLPNVATVEMAGTVMSAFSLYVMEPEREEVERSAFERIVEASAARLRSATADASA